MEDAVVVTKDAKGKVKLQQAMNLTLAGASSGGFWGLLIGMIFLNPLLGMALGASAGALSGKFAAANCFSDCALRQREVATYPLLISMNGTESQVEGHILSSADVGGDKKTT
jgi:hypothetical protein